MNINALETAKDLSIHSNNLCSRMQRIACLTGLNALGYHELTELLLAIESDAGAHTLSSAASIPRR